MKNVKTLIATFTLLILMNLAYSQETKTVDFLGVDFSLVDIVGALETQEDFHNAFKGINNLLHAEPEKYDVAKFLSLNINSTNTDVAIERIALHKDENLLQKDNNNFNVTDVVAGYPSAEGEKLLIVAKELNKAKEEGVFVAVFFDGATKKIISTKEFVGKAKGFGLRNFWAGSLYYGLKKMK